MQIPIKVYLVIMIIGSVCTLFILLVDKLDGGLNEIFNLIKDIREKYMNYKQMKSLNSENSTLIGKAGRKPIYISDEAKHVFVCGTTGSGKTVAVTNFIKNAIDKNYGLLLLDGKGDGGKNSMIDVTLKLARGKKKVYVIDLNEPMYSDKYNPFQNTNPTMTKDMLINMTNWSEEHYKLNCERYLQRLVSVLHRLDMKLSFESIVKNMSVNKFTALSLELMKKDLITKSEHIENMELMNTSGKIIEGATARFSTILESDLQNIFADDGIDIYSALKENAIIIFVLNPLIYPEISPIFGRLILIDSKKAVHKFYGDESRKFFIYDEIASYSSHALLDLVNKSRSANITCVLATQSLSDLDDVSEHFKEQVIENCNNYVILRQNSSVNAEKWSSVLGTRRSIAMTNQISGQHETGLGSSRTVRTFNYHPDDIKTLQTGEGIFISKDYNYHSEIKINKPF